MISYLSHMERSCQKGFIEIKGRQVRINIFDPKPVRWTFGLIKKHDRGVKLTKNECLIDLVTKNRTEIPHNTNAICGKCNKNVIVANGIPID